MKKRRKIFIKEGKRLVAKFKTGEIEMTKDGIYLYDKDNDEIICWEEEEWVEDPSVVNSIVNAVLILAVIGSDKLRKIVGRRK